MQSTPPDNHRIALFLPSLEGGGAERAFVELANNFASFGIEIDLVLVRASGHFLAEVGRGVRIVNLSASRTLLSLPRLVRYIRARRPAVMMSGLDTANLTNQIACWIAGTSTKAVLTQRSVLTSSWRVSHPRTAWLWMFALGLVYRRSRIVIANSESAAADLRLNLGLKERQLRVIPNSIDVRALRRRGTEDLRHPWVAPDSPPIILYVGSLTPLKDVPTLLRAFARLRQTHRCNLVLLGEGSERSRLESLTRNLRIRDCTLFLGFEPNPFRWMSRSRVLASASLSEGCPNVILQALTFGLQIVATNGIGGTREVLEDGRWGRLVPPGDHEAMSQALAAAIDSPMNEDGRTRATMFDPMVGAEAYLRLLVPQQLNSEKGIT